MLTADLADLQIWSFLKDCELSNLKNEGFWRFFLILPEPTHRADHRNVPRAPTKLIYYQSLFKNVGVGPTTKCHSCSTLPTLTNVEVARMIWYNNRRTTKNERVFLKHKSCYSFCRTTRDGVLPISMRIAALFYIFFVGDNPNFLFDNKISKQKFHKSYI